MKAAAKISTAKTNHRICWRSECPARRQRTTNEAIAPTSAAPTATISSGLSANPRAASIPNGLVMPSTASIGPGRSASARHKAPRPSPASHPTHLQRGETNLPVGNSRVKYKRKPNPGTATHRVSHPKKAARGREPELSTDWEAYASANRKRPTKNELPSMSQPSGLRLFLVATRAPVPPKTSNQPLTSTVAKIPSSRCRKSEDKNMASTSPIPKDGSAAALWLRPINAPRFSVSWSPRSVGATARRVRAAWCHARLRPDRWTGCRGWSRPASARRSHRWSGWHRSAGG